MSYYAEGARCQARDAEGLQCEREADTHREHRARAVDLGGWFVWQADPEHPTRTTINP